MKKIMLALLLLCTVLMAQPAPVDILQQQINTIQLILGALMMLLVVIAAIVYSVGQLFGAELRARATVWAKSMLAAVGVALVLFIILYLFLGPTLRGKPPPGSINEASAALMKWLTEIKDIAQSSFIILIISLVIIAALVYAVGQSGGAELRARASVWSQEIIAAAVIASVLYIIIFEMLNIFGAQLFSGMPFGLEIFGPAVIVPIAFFVSLIILITYVISRVFQVPEWEAYLSVELSNLVASFILLLFVLGFFAAGSVFSLMAVGKEKPTEAALDFLRGVVANNVLTGMYDIFRIQTCTSMLSTISRRIGEAVLTNVFKVFPGIDVFVQITNVLGYGFVAMYGSLSAQIALMNLVDGTMTPFLLPAGLILRFFPPTRDAGAFLIALAFGFQFVFPLLYLINGMVLKDIGVPMYDKARSELIISSICGPFKFVAAGFLFNPMAKVPVISSFPVFQNLFKNILSEPVLNILPMLEFVPIMKTLSVLSLYALFIPGFSMVITIAFINAMVKFLTMKV